VKADLDQDMFLQEFIHNFQHKDCIFWRSDFQTLSWNIPKKLPGVYRFLQLNEKKCYNGISYSNSGIAGRCNIGISFNYGAPKFDVALRQYSKSVFLLTPVFYLVKELNDYFLAGLGDKQKRDSTKLFLQEIEASHIAATDSVKNGYNTKTSDAGGSYGPEHAAACKAAYKKDPTIGPRRIVKRQALLKSDPTIVERQVAAYRATREADPSIAERQSQKAKLRNADPEHKIILKARAKRATWPAARFQLFRTPVEKIGVKMRNN
jgi:hypothetical protein